MYQGYSLNSATATAKVVVFNPSNNQITLTNVNGNFVSNQPIIGSITNSNYAFTSYSVSSIDYSQIIVVPNPPTSNSNGHYTYTTTITETPNIANTYPKV